MTGIALATGALRSGGQSGLAALVSQLCYALRADLLPSMYVGLAEVTSLPDLRDGARLLSRPRWAIRAGRVPETGGDADGDQLRTRFLIPLRRSSVGRALFCACCRAVPSELRSTSLSDGYIGYGGLDWRALAGLSRFRGSESLCKQPTGWVQVMRATDRRSWLVVS